MAVPKFTDYLRQQEDKQRKEYEKAVAEQAELSSLNGVKMPGYSSVLPQKPPDPQPVRRVPSLMEYLNTQQATPAASQTQRLVQQYYGTESSPPHVTAPSPSPQPAQLAPAQMPMPDSLADVAAPIMTPEPEIQLEPKRAPRYPKVSDEQTFNNAPVLVTPEPSQYLSERATQAAKAVTPATVSEFAQYQKVQDMKPAERYRLAIDIGKGKVKVTELEPNQIPWDQLFSQPMYGQIAAVGMKDPAQAYPLLVEMQRKLTGTPAEKQSILPPSFGAGFEEGVGESASLGVSQMAPGRTPVETAGQFVGQVAGALPGVLAAASTGGAAAGGLATRLAPQLVKSLAGHMLASGVAAAGTGATYQAAREGAQALARPEEADLKRSAQNIASTTGTYALFGGLSPVSSEILGGAGRLIANKVPGGQAMAQSVATAAKRYPTVAKGVEGAAEGLLTGGMYGTVMGGVDAVRDPEARSMKAFVQSAAQNAGEEFSENVVEALVLGLAQKWVPVNTKAVVDAGLQIQAEIAKVETSQTPQRDVLKEGLAVAEQVTGRMQPIWPPGKPIATDAPFELDPYDQALAKSQQQTLDNLAQESQKATEVAVSGDGTPAPQKSSTASVDPLEALFADRPDVVNVLRGQAQRVTLTNGDVALNPYQVSIMEDIVDRSGGTLSVDGNTLRFSGEVKAPALTPPQQPQQAQDDTQVLISALRQNRQRGENQYRMDVTSAMDPEPYGGFDEAAAAIPDEVARNFQVHGVAAGDKDASIVNLLTNGIDSNRTFHSGPPKGGLVDGVTNTRTRAPYLLISDAGKTLRETGVKNVVVNDAASANLAVLKQAFPNVRFMTPAEAASFIQSASSALAPTPNANSVEASLEPEEGVILPQKLLLSKPKTFGETVKVGDKVVIDGRKGVFEVVDTKDPSLLRVKTVSGAELPVGRATVKPVEQTATLGQAKVEPHSVERKTAQKEPWQMTRAEFDARWMEDIRRDLEEEVTKKVNATQSEISRLNSVIASNPDNPANATMRANVEQLQGEIAKQQERLNAPIVAPSAFMSESKLRDYRGVDEAANAGKQLPPEVLADYPDLQTKKAPATQQKGEEDTGTINETLRSKVDAQEGTGRDSPAMLGARPTLSSTASQKPLSDVSRRKIMQALGKLAPIREGGVRGALARFFRNTGIVRTKVAEDFISTSHEVGHVLDDAFGLSKDKSYDAELLPLGKETAPAKASADILREEGIGEFVRLYITEPDEAKQKAPRYYGAFEQVMKGLPEEHTQLLDVRMMVEQWKSLDPDDKMDATLSVGEKDGRMPFTFARYYQRMHEEFESLKRFTNLMTGGKTVPIDQDPYRLARLLRGWTGKATTFLRKGVVDDDFNVVGEPLEAILKDVDDLRLFRHYLVAKRAKEKLGQGMSAEQLVGVGWTEKEIDTILDRHKDKYDAIQQRLVKFQDVVLEELVKSEVLSPESRDIIKRMNQDYVPFYRWFEEGMGVGRHASTTQLGNTVNPIKRMFGSGRTIIDPIESIVKNTFMMVNVSQRNQILVAFDNIAEANPRASAQFWLPEATPMRSVQFNLDQVKKEIRKALEENGVNLPTVKLKDGRDKPAPLDLDEVVTVFVPFAQPKGAKTQISLKRNGETKIVSVDPDLYRSLMALDTESGNILTKIFSYPASILRQGAVLNPDFMASNPFADQPTAFAQSDNGYIPWYSFMRGMYHFVNKTDLYWKGVAAGGDQAGLSTLDRNQIQEQLDELQEQARLGTLGSVMRSGDAMRILRMVADYGTYPIRHPIRTLGNVGEVFEVSTRMGEFLHKAERDIATEGRLPEGRTLKERALGTDLAPLVKRNTAMEGAFDMRNITTDFRQRGTWTRNLSPVKAFFQAQMTSNKNAIKTMIKHPLRTSVKMGIYYTLPTIVLYLMNRDNPWWEEKKQWQKDAFWFVPLPWTADESGHAKHFLWIPRKHLYSMTFGVLPERMMRWLDKQDRQAFDGYAKNLMDTLWPGDVGGVVPLPTLLGPPIENETNQSFYTDMPLVPQREMRFEPKDRYDTYTSETAKAAVRLLDEIHPALTFSPRYLDNLVRGYSGGLGTLVVKGFDVGLDATGIGDDIPPVDRGVADWPIARRFLRDQGGTGPGASVDEFYDVRDKMEQKYNSTADGPVKKAMLDVMRPWRKADEIMADLRAKKRDVLASEKLTPQEKRELIDRIDLAMTNLARQALGKEPIND